MVDGTTRFGTKLAVVAVPMITVGKALEQCLERVQEPPPGQTRDGITPVFDMVVRQMPYHDFSHFSVSRTQSEKS
jgi:hypothetical protein